MNKKLQNTAFKVMDVIVILTMVFGAPLNVAAAPQAQVESPALSTNQADYAPGESAHIAGAGFDAGDYVLSATGPDGTADWGTVTANEDGGFESDSPELASAGTYEVSAYAAGSEEAIASTSFTVTAPPAPTDPPTEEPTATEPPTEEPTPEPTQEPTATESPTEEPTQEPTATDTTEPTTTEPTAEPTNTSTAEPTSEPTDTPTSEPTATTEPTPLPPPYLETDQADYFAGERVILTGGNWQPGEAIHIFVNDNVGQTWNHHADIVAGEDGTFTYEFFLPNWFVATYNVIATGAISGIATLTFTDAPGSYSFDLAAADPGDSPTYPKVTPAQLACPAPSGGSGTAADPLANAIFGSPKDAVESLAPDDMILGQIVPFEMQVRVTNTTSPENGTIEFTASWRTDTTSGDNFGYDPAYLVYCAFVDTNDTGNANLDGDEKVDSYSATVVGNEIVGTFQVSGFDDNDRVVVEIWMVLKSTIPAGTGGNVQAEIDSARTCISVNPCVSGGTISAGNQTVPLLQVGQFFSTDANLSITKSDSPDPVLQGAQLTYTINVTNSGPDTANGIVVTDMLDPNTSYVSSSIPCSGTTTLTCNAGNLTVGQSTSFTITVLVSNSAPTNVTAGTAAIGGTCTVGSQDLCNRVSVDAINDDPTPGNNSDSEPTNVLPLGGIVINKVAIGGNATFSYTTTGSGLSNFNITTTSGSGSQSFTGIAPGAKTVTEASPPAGWDFTSLSCSDPDNGTTTTGQTANIDLDSGETVTCTFTNTKRGHIIVDKVTSPAADPTSFSFDANGGTSPAYADFSLTDAATPNDQELKPGAYSVTETVPAGWTLSNLVCSDPDGGTTTSNPTANIDLDAGETVTCTFTNTKQFGKITVVKDTVPDDPQDFNFTGSGPGGFNFGGGFNLDDDSNGTLPNFQTFSNLSPGTYSVAETPVTGFDTVASCLSSLGDTETAASIELDPNETVTCTFTNTRRGTIIVVKDAVPNDPQDFAFTGGGPDGFNFGGGFSLDDDADNTLFNSATFSNLVPGGYSVVETAVPGWDLTSATCDDGSNPASIGLSAGETVTCTFTNTKRGRILVDKVTNPSGDTTSFEFDPGYGPNFLLTDTDPANDSGPLTPGNYSVAEVSIPTGWDLTSATCDDGSAPGAIALSAGETVTCTFTNTKRGSIVIIKDAVPDDAQDFAFTGSGPSGFNFGGGFSLDDDADNSLSNTATFSGLVPGGYSVAEAAVPGWDLTSATCDDGSAPASISLQAGEAVTCTFTNTKRGRILVDKVTNPAGDVTNFEFDPNYGANFLLADADAPNDSGLLTPGTYSVAEVNIPAGWDLTSATCSDNSPVTAISLQAGETITCTFTNTKRGNIVVVKQTDPDGDTQEFTFSASYDNDGFSLSDGQSNDSGPLSPGSYSVSETVPAGWDLTSATCSDNSLVSAISLQAGETVTCTFTNQKDASIVVVKQTDPDGDPQEFDFNASWDLGPDPDFSLSDGESNNSGDLDPGNYSVSESVPLGWDLESATCSDGSPVSAISLQAGETVTCTFVNEKDSNIVVVKQTDPDGDPQEFTFTASYDGDGFSLSDGQSNDSGDLDPGTYSVSETVPAGWDLTSGTCSDGSAPASISLQAGETVTCTFTNQKDASIVVVKQTDPDGDPQAFSFSASYDGDGFSLSDGQSSDSGDLNPGIYSVSETLPAGWDLTSATCSDGSAPGAINLSAGETVTCTFTNQKDANIVVVKQTDPDGALQSFEFDPSYGANFSLTDGQQNDSGDLDPGPYSVAELTPAGWDLTSTVCTSSKSDSETAANISLQAGETVTCTFTNQKDANIVVVKQTDPNGDPQIFEFTASYDADGFSLSDGQSNDSGDLDPGTYSVSETVPSGWELNSATCDNDDDPSSITLNAGETVTCTFVNEKAGSIVIVKNTLGGDGTFDFTSDTLGAFSLTTVSNTASTTFSNLDVDITYDVAETVPAGWELNSATCDNGETIDSIDLEPGETVTCTFEDEKAGSIVIVKNTLGGDGTFDFTSTTLGDFSLTTVAGTAQTSFTDLDVDVTYDVAETVPTGWELNSAGCDNGETIDSIDLEPGETVTCTFEDEKAGSIVIVKNTLGGDGTFDFTSATLGNFQLTSSGGTAQTSFSNLDVDETYDVAETVPAGWELNSATCDNGETIDSVDLEPGETVTCTFEDEKAGSIVIVKNTLGGDGTFDFTSTALGDFSLTTVSNTASTTFSNLDVDETYDVDETVPAGWELNSATCDNGETIDSIDLEPGETVTCTFEDEKAGSIVIVKNTLGGDGTFDFTSTTLGNFQLTSSGGTAQTSFDNLDVDVTYDVDETVPTGWELNSATCDNDDDPSSITLNAGETVTCTFENEKAGSIVIVKKTLGGDGTFDFTSTTLGDFSLTTVANTASTTFSNLDVDETYDVDETVPAGWELNSATCDNGETIDSIDLDPGETVTCTFEDEKAGSIVIVKNTLGGDGTFDFTSDTLGAFSLTTVSNTASTTFSNLDVDETYDVAETVPAGWELNSATCDNGETIDSVDLEPGETVTCTFENEKAGSIVIVKNTLGGDGIFDFTSDTLGAFSLTTVANTASTTFSNLDVDITYDVAETVPAGWDLNSATCDNGETIDSIYLDPGETVTCTFTNTKRGHIIIDKVTNPSGDTQSFNFDANGGTDPAYVDFSLTDAAAPNDQELKPGTYSVSETVPAGWDLESATCSDGSDPSAIDLGAGETVTCTFTNEKDAFIIVDKVTNPAGDTTSFEFDPSYAANFFLTDGSAPNNSGDLDPGTHSVAELTPVGWDLTSATCSDGSNPNAINLSAGETVTCTFTNTKRGHIIVDKVTLPSGDTQSFTFTTTGGSYAGFNLTDTAAPNDQTLVPSTYSVTESAVAGWDLTGLSCTDPTGAPVISGNKATINLAAGETVNCTFTNTKRGSISIVKDAVPNDAQDFAFTSTIPGAATFNLDDDSNATLLNTKTVTNLLPGTHSVTEGAVAGWDLTGLTCNDANGTVNLGTRTAGIMLDPGENITCTFTNTKRGTIIVEKQTNPNGAPGTFTFTGTAAGIIADNGTITVANLVPGTYTSTEANPAATLFALTSIVCNDGSSASVSTGNLATRTATFKLDPGETVRCVFTNTKDFHAGTIGFWKNWRNHYNSTQFQLLINYLKTNNPKIYNKDLLNNNTDDLTVAKVDAIFNLGSATPREQMILAQFTALKFNLAITQLDGTGGLVQKNDDLCLAGVVDVSGISGAATFFGTSTPTVGQIVNAVENRWTGKLTTIRSDWKWNLTNAQKDMIIKVTTGINEGTLVTSSGCP